MLFEMQEYFNIANENFYNNNFQEAIDNYTLGINHGRVTVYNIALIRDAYNKMSQSYFELEKLELAIYANDELLKLDPASSFGLNNREFFRVKMISMKELMEGDQNNGKD